MALKLKYKDEHGILHINMSPSGTPHAEPPPQDPNDNKDITDPKFDSINTRFGQYDLFGGKYDVDNGGDTPQSLFRSRYNSIEEELANTPYAFATERSLRLSNANNNLLDITIHSRFDEPSPSKDIEDNRFFNRSSVDYDDSLFGPQIEGLTKSKASDSDEPVPAFTVTQLIHAQDRYFDLSSRQSSSVIDSPKGVKSLTNSFEVRSAPSSAKTRTVRIVDSSAKSARSDKDEAFKVLSSGTAVKTVQPPSPALPVVPTSSLRRKRESSFAIIAETPTVSRPSSPRSLPVEIRPGRVSPFKGRGFREETSRHNTPKTSATNSRANSPPRRRTRSLSRIDKMAQIAALPPPIHNLNSRPHSPRNFLKENIEEVRELSELNREKHEAEAEKMRKEEEEALLKEMGLLDKNAKSDAIRSIVCSRTTSRSSSPNKINLRSRSNSPSAILHFENISAGSKEYINQDDGMPKPVTHESRLRSVSRSQPQSNDGSPKHSKIPKRQNSVSPARSNRRDNSNSKYSPENNLNKNQRFISNSTSSIHETIKIGSQVHDKRTSKSTQFLNISPAHIRGKPPISPGRGGPPPSNKSINAKRLSPIVGTPNKSPVEDLKPCSAKTTGKPSPVAKKSVKTAGNTPATSRLNSRQPSRTVSRDTSPDKRRTNAKTPVSKTNTTKAPSKILTRTPSTKTLQKTPVPAKPESKKPINRTNSMKSLTRTPSTRTLNEKPPILKKRDSVKDLTAKSQSTSKLNELGTKKDTNKQEERKTQKSANKDKSTVQKSDSKKKESKVGSKKLTADSKTGSDEITKQDNETQYDKTTNEKGELVILTKKSVVSMTTAAITSQPLEVVTTVTNQLPAAFEKAREKGIFERLSSKDSLIGKDEDKDTEIAKTETQDISEEKMKEKDKVKEKEKDKEKDKDKEKEKDIEKIEKIDDKKQAKPGKSGTSIFAEDNIKLKLLQPPYNNPQVERVKNKIDELLKEPEVSAENILVTTTKITKEPIKETKNTFKNVADKTKTDIRDAKDEVANKLTEIKDLAVKQNDKITAEIRSEASKIVDSIITPVEEPKDVKEKVKEEIKKDVEPIVVVVNEKKRNEPTEVEKVTETLVKGEAEVEVQSSNVSTPGGEKMAPPKKMLDGNDSDKSTHSNGGFPQSTSTTPKPPVRTNRKHSKEENTQSSNDKESTPEGDQQKKQNICQRLMGKCKKCCPCCVKGESDDEKETKDAETQKSSFSKLNCCKKNEKEENDTDVERAAGKAATIEYESETKRKRKLRDILCGCCGRRRRVSDVSDAARNVADVAAVPGTVDTGCCGKKKPEVERRDSILSDRPPANCCARMSTWMRGACRRHHSEQSSSRRTSMFSKNKSLSPTLPPEDNRQKLDASLVEHTSMMRGAIPVLPIVLAYFCLFCNVIVPGLGSIFSGMFCLCFGIPRFGVHDGAKHRIGSFVINLVVGCSQLFTVLFCLVGWGWSIWWGVIYVKVARKYRKLKAEAAAEEAEAAPPVTANNHTRA